MSGASASPVGRQARVTGTVGPGLVGEVMLAIRGGSESFYAYALLRGDRFEVDEKVLVMEYEPPRIVRVVAAEN